jgi:hypothetical protein
MNNSPTGQLLRRAEELDALDAILPFDRRERLAELLTDDDIATLKHLAGEGMGGRSPSGCSRRVSAPPSLPTALKT